MTEEYKQAIVDSIKAQRQLDDSSEFAKELNALVKEGVSDSMFMAKVNTALSIFDQSINKEGQTGLGSNLVTKKVLENSLNDAIASTPLEGPVQGYSPGQYKPWLVNTPLDVVQDILMGFDMSAGVEAGGENSEAYFEFLKGKLDEWYDTTGQIGAIVKPGGGKGYVLFSSEDYDRYKKNYDAPSVSVQQFRETDPGRTKVPKVGFRAEPTVLYEPIMTGEPGKYEFSGEYNSYIKDRDEKGTPLTVKESGGLVTKINNATGETEQLTVSASELVALTEQQLDGGYTVVQSQDSAIVNQAKQAVLGQTDYNVGGLFGGITPGYTVYKNPDLASVFEEGKELTPGDLAAETITLSSEDAASRYGGQDHIQIGFNMLPQERVQVQTDLLQAGYLSYDDWFFEQGTWGDKSQSAMLSAMTASNYELTDIGTHLSEEKQRLYKRPPLLPQVYTEPSPTQIKAEVDGALGAIGINRELSEAEMVAFADFYTQSSRDYQTAVADYNKNYDLAQRMFPGASKTLVVPETPDAKLSEYADAVLGAEVQATQQATKERNDLSYLFSTVDAMSRLASSG